MPREGIRGAGIWGEGMRKEGMKCRILARASLLVGVASSSRRGRRWLALPVPTLGGARGGGTGRGQPGGAAGRCRDVRPGGRRPGDRVLGREHAPPLRRCTLGLVTYFAAACRGGVLAPPGYLLCRSPQRRLALRPEIRGCACRAPCRRGGGPVSGDRRRARQQAGADTTAGSAGLVAGHAASRQARTMGGARGCAIRATHLEGEVGGASRATRAGCGRNSAGGAPVIPGWEPPRAQMGQSSSTLDAWLIRGPTGATAATRPSLACRAIARDAVVPGAAGW